MKTLVISPPDDWHVHLRDGVLLNDTVAATAVHFKRALVMPNLQPALTGLDSIIQYREQVLAALAKEKDFTPYFTFYCNESVDPNDLCKSKKYPFILGAKLYPAGATTNSEEGARSLVALYPLLEIMQEQNLVLQIHGELNQGDIFHREAAFLESCLKPLLKNFPKLRMVLEHISTEASVDFVIAAGENLAATITPQHLLYNRNQLLAGGIKPHYYCLPILKKEKDQIAIQKAAVSGNPKFFAGTDSAPHSLTKKESPCGCAGIFSAPYALPLYAECFSKLGKLNQLNAFVSRFGAEFYQLLPNPGELLLQNTPQTIPKTRPLGSEKVVPIAAGELLQWSVYESH